MNEPTTAERDKAHQICAEIERRMARIGVVTTAHYDAGMDLIAQALAEARQSSRAACSEIETAMKAERDRVIEKSIVQLPGGSLGVVAGWRVAPVHIGGVRPCWEICKTPEEAVQAARRALGLADDSASPTEVEP